MAGFLCGLVTAAAILGPVGYVLLRRQGANVRRQSDSKGRQLEELSKLTGGLAHEIKNPLSTIKVNLKLIIEDAAAGEGKEQRWFRKIEVVQKETQRLEHILDDFLRYIGNAELKLSTVDVNEMVGEMIDFYLPQAQSQGVTIRQGLEQGELFCDTDSDLIKQVILNLFINGVQAMPDGGELIVRTEVKGPNAVVEISDTGLGIEPEKLDKIFDAYYTTKRGGSGLGLPTARKIVEAHSGNIRVTSQAGKGTSFAIELPLVSAKDIS